MSFQLNFLDRYIAGENTRVWQELLALGAEIREEPLFMDAKAVAHETMLRAKKNLQTIILRLDDLHFEFGEPDHIFSPTTARELESLAKFEQTIGPLPLAVSEWYRVGGEVCLAGSHPELSEYFWTGSNSPLPKSKTYAGPLSDPLVIFPVEANLGGFEDFSDFERPFDFSISPDAVFKANYGGGGSTFIRVPDLAIDAPLLENWVDFTFVEYLRDVFRWGGFPSLAGSSNPPGEILAYLTKDLLPI